MRWSPVGGVALAAAVMAAPEPSGACSIIDPCELEEVLVLGEAPAVRSLGGSADLPLPALPDGIEVVFDGTGRPLLLRLGEAELSVWEGVR